jgi:hypothetical protein
MKSNFEAQQEALLRKNREGIKSNPKVMVNAGEFMSLISRRCRVCYFRVIDCVKNGGVISSDWANMHLCVNCLVLYKNRIPKEE